MSTTQAQPDPTDPVTLHHVALYVSDLDRTRAFYCNVLGMHEISRPADFTFPGGLLQARHRRSARRCRDHSRPHC